MRMLANAQRTRELAERAFAKLDVEQRRRVAGWAASAGEPEGA
jgi:hypothetical protein